MNSPLENYLGAVESSLRLLPESYRGKELLEIKAHLESLVEAYQECGMPGVEAQSEAVAQFGAAAAVGWRLNQAYLRNAIAALLHGRSASVFRWRMAIIHLSAASGYVAIELRHHSELLSLATRYQYTPYPDNVAFDVAPQLLIVLCSFLFFAWLSRYSDGKPQAAER